MEAQFPIEFDLTDPITDRSLAANQEMGGSVFGYFPYFATMPGDERLSARWRELASAAVTPPSILRTALD